MTAAGDVAVVLRVLYLIFSEGDTGSVDLAAAAIRLTRQLLLECDEPEVAGLLALMLLHHARRAARTDANGVLVPLDRQDRSLWNQNEIAEGVRILQAALARDRRGEYQMQAAIAALHDDAPSAEETDWPQILAWYDELLALTDNPAAALSRAVAVGQVDGPLAGLRAIDGLEARLGDTHRLDAVRGHLHERAGHLDIAGPALHARRGKGTQHRRTRLPHQAGRAPAPPVKDRPLRPNYPARAIGGHLTQPSAIIRAYRRFARSVRIQGGVRASVVMCARWGVWRGVRCPISDPSTVTAKRGVPARHLPQRRTGRSLPVVRGAQCVVAKKRWSDLDPRVRQAILLGGAFEAGLKIAALIDLRQRPRREIRGSKAAWATALVLVNSGGVVPIVYLLRGRRTS